MRWAVGVNKMTVMQLSSRLHDLLQTVQAQGTAEGLNLIAFSGGVDSTLVAALVKRVFPERTLAMLGVSQSLPLEQLRLARRLAQQLQVPLEELETHEGKLSGYVANTGDACYYCKSTLYETMQQFSHAVGERLRTRGAGLGVQAEVVLFNGTNADDLRDPTRVGLQAAREYRVASPLSALSKQEVREVSRQLGLENWGYAASPCLRSRLAYGVPATPENLKRVEAAEQLVRDRLQLGPEVNLRVRQLLGGAARLKLDAPLLVQQEDWLPLLRDAIVELGFVRLEVQRFQSGALSLAV